MRRFFLLSASIIMLSAAIHAQDEKKNKNDKDKPRVEGSGNVITKNVAVSSFNELNVSGVFSVLLIQGNAETVKIEADDNLQEFFEVKNDGSKLNITMKKDLNFNSKKKMKVYVTFKNLKSMDLKTVGDVSSEENLKFDDIKINNKSVGSVDLKMTAHNLDVDNKSVGNVKLNGKAESVVIRNKGVGSVQAADFIVQNMDIENSGVGNADVNAEKELKVKDSFLGKVNNKGKATVRTINKVRI
ncbi:MAG: head GIN domain-containing protein [Chitinophagaceae bacterium]